MVKFLYFKNNLLRVELINNHKIKRNYMTNAKGKSIKLFMVDGTPQGILTLEVMNWTGHILVGPRTKITELILRPEMNKTGLYFLTGSDPDGSSRPMVYVGESDNVGNRLKQHNKDEVKDFWERAIVITSKDQNLTKAHVRYLEGRFISIAKEIDSAKLFNSTSPKNENLPEADIADMEYFITQIRLIMPILGLDFLRDKPKVSIANQNNPLEIKPIDASPFFEITSKKHNIKATAREIEGEFIVLAGSNAQSKWIGQNTKDGSYGRLFVSLYQEGKIKVLQPNDIGVFQEDVTFNSPSAASAVIYGRHSNGRTSWKVKNTNKTYEDWQNELLNNLKEEQNM